jgi:hypothetical protein
MRMQMSILGVAAIVVLWWTAQSAPVMARLNTAQSHLTTFRSPLQSLLPTVTPPPGSSATPAAISTPTATASPEPEPTPVLYPIYPTRWTAHELALQGVSFTENRIGVMPLDESSPAAMPDALCANLSGYECTQTIERHLLESGAEGVIRDGERLEIVLRDGWTMIFTNRPDADTRLTVYSYAGYLHEIGYYVILALYWEGGDYLLVNSATGAVTAMPGKPVLSPDGRRLGVFAGVSDSYVLQIWDVTETGLHLAQAWGVWHLPVALRGTALELVWTAADAFQIQPANSPEQDAPIRGRLDGAEWEITFNGKPMPRVVMDVNSITYRYGHAFYSLETLVEGAKVYRDRDYIFTHVPAELVGKQYFLLPNNATRDTVADYLRFAVTDRAAVYVALDVQAGELPDWMQQGWERLDAVLETDDIPLQLYRKVYPAGVVTLGGNWMPPASGIRSHYVVVVAPVR